MSENEEDVRITSCACCHVLFSKDFIAQINENEGHLFCEYCGVEINKNDFITNRATEKTNNDQNVPEEPITKEGAPSTKEEETLAKEEIPPTKEEIEEQLKIFIFRRAYELLKDPHYVLELKKDQKDLDAYQLKVMAGLLRSRLIHLAFEEDWLAELSPLRRQVFDYYSENFTRKLKSKRIYREHYVEFFQDAIQMIFKLIKGYPVKAGLQETRLQILIDLKKVFGFSICINANDAFEFRLTLFVAAKLYYSKTFRETVLKFFDNPGELNQAVDRFVLENAHTLEKREFLREWINTLKRTNKIAFKIKLNNLLSEVNSDHVFCESFLDYLEGLTRIVLELIRGEYEVSQLDDFRLRVLDFLLSTNPFVNDRELQAAFLPKFMVVLSRIVRRRIQNALSQMTKAQAKAAARSLLGDISTRMIRPEYFHGLSGISQNEFEENYSKVQVRINRDRIYRANFFKFLYTLFLGVSRLIHEKCDPKKFSEEERLIFQDFKDHGEYLEKKGTKSVAEKEVKIFNSDSSNQERTKDSTRENERLENGEAKSNVLDEKEDSNPFSSKPSKGKKKKKELLTQRIQIPYSKRLSEICQLSKKLWKCSVFVGRQAYFLINPPPYIRKHKIPLAKKYPEFAERLLEFMESRIDSPSLFAELREIVLVNPTLQISGELTKKLMKLWSLPTLYEWFKFDFAFTNLGQFYSQLPTQTLKKVRDAWRSYIEGIQVWRTDPQNFTGRPQIPSYGRKTDEFLILFAGEHIRNQGVIQEHYEATKRETKIRHRKTKELLKSYTTAELLLPNKFLSNFTEKPFPKIRTTIALDKIREVRIVPKSNCYEVEIVYSAPEKQKIPLDPNKIASIDQNLNNLLVITSNIYLGGQKLPPVIIRGYYAKWANQLMNKEIAKLQSERTEGMTMEKGLMLPETLEMKQIRQKRQNRIRNYFHFSSHFLIEFCNKFEIGTVIIGHNNYWKQEINLGRQTNQNFVFVPFNCLIDQIKYKAEMAGIKVLVKPEGYTSLSSVLDGDPIPDYDPDNKYTGEFSGYRAPSMRGKKSKKEIAKERQKTGIFEIDETKRYNPRGLYKSKVKQMYIHSDVDGSFNIFRKYRPDEFNKLSIKDLLVSPIAVNLLKHSSRRELDRLVSLTKSGSIATSVV